MRKADTKEKLKNEKRQLNVINNDTDRSTDTEQNRSDHASENHSAYKRITLGGLLVLLFMLLYIPSLLNWLSGSTISRDIIRNGVIEESINANGIIIRDEVLLEAPEFKGRYVADVGEGEKTPAYSRIATVLNDTSDVLLQEIEEINAKIVKARMEKAEKADFFSEDLVKLDTEIGLQVQNMITACNTNDFSAMGLYRTEITKIVEKKAEIVGENATDSYITALKQQKAEAQKKLNVNTTQVISNLSGIVSYVIDGYENVLRPDIISEITVQQLEQIQDEHAPQKEYLGKADAGEPVAKIIKGTDIFIAALLSEESLENFEAGKKINLRLNDIGLETSGSIESISEPQKGKVVVTVRTSRGADKLSAERIVNVDFISKTEEGLKVPVRSLRNISQDGQTAEIMLIKFKVAALRTVDIICRDEDYAIIRTPEKELQKTVNLYDNYIVNPDKIKEGDIIDNE